MSENEINETPQSENKQTPINPVVNNESPKSKFEKTPLNYGKKLYIGEFIIENFIKLVAFVSIAAIFAIFYYVFQEAGYAFSKNGFSFSGNEQIAKSTPQINPDNKKTTANDSQAQEDLKPAAYGSSSENLTPESYGSDKSGAKTAKSEDLKPESYGSSSENLTPESYGSDNSSAKPAQTEDLKPESYGSSSENLTPESYGDAKPVATPSTTTETEVKSAAEPAQSQKAPVSSELAGEDKKITLNNLFRPNDVINGKEEYIWQPVGETPKYSLIPLFIGALKATLIALVISAPIAILAALFTVSFAPRRIKEFIKPIIEILAGFPSVVIGFFCLITLSTIIQNLFHTTYRLNSFVGGLGMAIAVIPIIYTVAEDALSSVPKHLKEAGLAMGATRWQTAFKIMLPAATPGVFAAVILGVGRAFGETMIALMATGNAALVSADIFESVRTMAATIGAEMAEVETRSGHYGVLFLIGAILFVITFCLNALAEFYVRKKLLKKFQGL